ncbi:MAG: ATP-grasp domain-containing protein, partial [Actinomycetota bacterium]
MDLFEYQGKQYFARYDIPVSPGGPADTVEEAVVEANNAGYPVVVKAQVQVGGRGKAGFVKLVKTADDATDAARFMLSNKMVSPQTGEDGLEVKKLLVAAGV